MSKYSISFSYFVDVTTQSVSSAFSVGRLNGLVITKPTELTELFQEFQTAEEVANIYGLTSQEYQYALTYFSFISKLATKPKLLTFANLYESAQPGALKCAKVTNVGALKQNGSFTISIDSESRNIEVDLTSVVSLTDVATKIQEALRAISDGGSGYSDAVCEWSSITQGYIIKSGTTGISSSVSDMTAGTSGVDLSILLKGRLVDGCTIIAGSDANTLAGLINEIFKQNGNYYSISLMWDLTSDDATIIEFGTLIKSNVVRFAGIVCINDKRAVQNTDYFDSFAGLDGLLINYSDDIKINAFLQGFIASLDYQALNSNQNCNFIPASTFNVMIESGSELTYLGQNRLNSIYSVGGFGQDQTLYGEGKIMGDSYKNAIVYFGNSYLVLQLQIAGVNLFIASPLIALRGGAGKGSVLSVQTPVLENAIKSGIIVKGADLTAIEKNQVLTITGDSQAPDMITANGYYLHVEDVTEDDIANNRMRLTLIYVANIPTNRLQITNYLLGA